MTNSRKQRFNTIRVVFVLLLLVLALMPFFVMKHDNAFHLLKQRLEQSTTPQDNFQQVSCPEILKDPTIVDPNKDLEKNETKRLTITDPKFYISLFNEYL